MNQEKQLLSIRMVIIPLPAAFRVRSTPEQFPTLGVYETSVRLLGSKLPFAEIADLELTEDGGIRFNARGQTYHYAAISSTSKETPSEDLTERLFNVLATLKQGGLAAAQEPLAELKRARRFITKSMLVTDVSTEDLLPQVSAELDAIIGKKRTPWQNLGALVLSLILFVSLGLFRNSISGVALLVGVIFVHECGHFIGMKLLRYKDVQMFFIPLFGAAVSGTETAPSGPKKAIVSLLGPVPGIVIGVATGIAYLKTRQPLLVDATRTFFFLNTFNLFPFHPLDGGRFFDAILFSRHPKLELGFKIVTTLILGWLAVTFKDVVFGFFAFVVFISLRSTYISASIAHSARKQMGDGEDYSSDAVPARKAEQLIAVLREKLPADQLKPKLIATYITGIWQRIRNRPCPVGPAIALVVCYVFFILLGVGSGFVFEMAALAIKELHTELVTRTLPTGETIRVNVASIRGQKLSETQVNDEGLFDGTEIVWHMFTTNRSEEGHWRNGFWHGEWKFWNAEGHLTEIVDYDMGKLIRCRKLIHGEMRDVPRAEWPRLRTLIRQAQPRSVKSNAGQKEESNPH